MLRKIDHELDNLAKNDQLTQNWETVEKAVEATIVAKSINTNIHVEYEDHQLVHCDNLLSFLCSKVLLNLIGSVWCKFMDIDSLFHV